jgi:hypothetical protein
MYYEKLLDLGCFVARTFCLEMFCICNVLRLERFVFEHFVEVPDSAQNISEKASSDV